MIAKTVYPRVIISHGILMCALYVTQFNNKFKCQRISFPVTNPMHNDSQQNPQSNMPVENMSFRTTTYHTHFNSDSPV